MKRILLVILFLLPIQCFSQYELTERDWYIGGGAAILAGGGNLLELLIEESPTNEELSATIRDDVFFLDRPATYHYNKTARTLSDISIGALLLSPSFFLLDNEARKDALPLVVMYSQGLAFIEGITSIVKSTVARPRPYVYNTDVSDSIKINIDAKKSFFSSHSAYAFYSAAFVSSISMEYLNDKAAQAAVIAGAYTLASLVGYLRYEGGMHFPTDILTGAIVGTIIGYYIPYIHKEKEKDSGSNSNLFLYPPVNGIAVGFSYKF